MLCLNIGTALRNGLTKAESSECLLHCGSLCTRAKGHAQAGGHVQLAFLNIASSLVHVRAGKVKGIAVTSSKRSRSPPQVPTIAESGVPGYELYERNALFAPAGTPPEIIARLNAEVVKIMAAPDVQERFFQLGAEAATSTPERLGAFIKSEMAKYARLIRQAGIRAE